jgi:hypothetical protein
MAAQDYLRARPGRFRPPNLASLLRHSRPSHSRCVVITRSGPLKATKSNTLCCHPDEFVLAIIHTLIREEDALKALSVLEEPGLPVELNATLELAADFAKDSEYLRRRRVCRERASDYRHER